MAQVEGSEWTGWTTAGIGNIDLGRNNLVGVTTDFTKCPPPSPKSSGSMSVLIGRISPKRECWLGSIEKDELQRLSLIEFDPNGQVYLMDGHGQELAHTGPLEVGQWYYIEFDQRNFTITATPGRGPQ